MEATRMRINDGFAAYLAVPLVLISTQALSDGVAVNVTNDGTDDIMLTVYDTTIRPRVVVLSQRVNGFTTIPVHLTQDPEGRANLSWTAVTVDPTSRRCGHADRPGLGDAAAVNVHVDSACSSDGADGQGSIRRTSHR